MLIVFIDALPASQKFFIKGFRRHPLLPNLGYSVNLHNEIFNGKTPDEIGFFGEYRYNPNPNKFKILFFKLLQPLEHLPFRFSGLLKVAFRRIFKIKMGQIPFEMLPYFELVGKYPFIGECDSILSKFECFVTDSKKEGLGKRDIVAINEFLAHLNRPGFKKNIFISLCDLDGLGHKYGTASLEYEKHLKFLEKKCNTLIKCYLDNHPKEPVIVLSDHGMSDVSNYIDASKTFKKIKSQFRAIVFYDSLYFHIFLNKKQIINQVAIETILRSELPITIFDKFDREKHGISEKKFGNIVGVLNNNYAFSPNLFGFLKLKAYHGYLPKSESNKGVFWHYNLKRAKLKDEISSLNAYDIINENL